MPPAHPASRTPPDATSPPPLTIRLLGPTEILYCGRPLPPLRTHKGMLLMGLLTLRQGAPVDRAWLAATLWPDSFLLQAQYNLRRCLSDLRTALGTESYRIETPTSRTVRLELSGAEVDTKFLEDAMHIPEGVDSREEALKDAVARYRGKLMEGCTEEWVDAERTRYAELYMNALEILAQLAGAAGDHMRRITYLRLAVAAQPEREHTQRFLMQALADIGDAAAVTQAFRALRVYLRDTMGVEPSRETRALYQTISDRFSEEPARPLTAHVVRELPTSPRPPEIASPPPSSGAILPGSAYYIERLTDRQVLQAIHRGDGLVLIKGPRQIGKTSLIAQTVTRLRSEGRRAFVTDVEALGAPALHSASTLVSAMIRNLKGQLNKGGGGRAVIETPGAETGLLPGEMLERFLEDELLQHGSGAAPVVWVLDEVDSIFTREFRDEIFALFRSWYNSRAFEPTGIWRNLTLVISFATEAHLFITDLNQSPFNVGTRFTLADFSRSEVETLNERFRAGFSAADLSRLTTLLGGHPYLNHRALAAIVAGETDLPSLEAMADHDRETIFSDHLRRMEGRILGDPTLHQAMSALLSGTGNTMSPGSFHRLRSAGVLTGDTVALASCRCRLYEQYLRRRLLNADTPTRVPSG